MEHYKKNAQTKAIENENKNIETNEELKKKGKRFDESSIKWLNEYQLH